MRNSRRLVCVAEPGLKINSIWKMQRICPWHLSVWDNWARFDGHLALSHVTAGLYEECYPRTRHDVRGDEQHVDA